MLNETFLVIFKIVRLLGTLEWKQSKFFRNKLLFIDLQKTPHDDILKQNGSGLRGWRSSLISTFTDLNSDNKGHSQEEERSTEMTLDNVRFIA